MEYGKKYWEHKYEIEQTGWDIGYIATPIKEYIDQLTDKSIKILIPGAGNAYEAEYLFQNGFKNTYVLDFADIPIKNFLKRCPEFPQENIIKEDFFIHKGDYDLIIEHTFFSSIHPLIRADYSNKVSELLTTNGKLVGILFNIDFGNNYPPFGGDEKAYRTLFLTKFHIKTIEIAYNSIKPRANNELFIIFEKK